MTSTTTASRLTSGNCSRGSLSAPMIPAPTISRNNRLTNTELLTLRRMILSNIGSSTVFGVGPRDRDRQIAVDQSRRARADHPLTGLQQALDRDPAVDVLVDRDVDPLELL